MFSKTNGYILELFISGSGHNMALDYSPGFSEVISEASAEFPFAAKHTESHFTRGELEIC